MVFRSLLICRLQAGEEMSARSQAKSNTEAMVNKMTVDELWQFRYVEILFDSVGTKVDME